MLISVRRKYKGAIYPPKKKLRSVRRSKDVSLRQMADHFGVTEATISNYESGRTSVTEEFMVGSANFLNVDVFELFPESPLLRHLRDKFKVSKV
ncbi:helix-turn-helix domain-containing protein [Paenibacillus sp. MBLB4367]|uniref:helix-turn-helix domain-containing protein n=1 Tax=Paenibacillus sp. MBLB4367 TaxID=3384767 RepID=UPI003907FE75